MKIYLAVLFLFLICGFSFAQEVAPLWTEYSKAKKLNTVATLPDFSYAGYHCSEKEIPDIRTRKYFKVTDFGATPNDASYDDAGIQAAIKAAENNPGGGVVFFPAGKFIIAPDEDKNKFISITKSNIVLKGSGSGKNGTEIYQDKMRVNGRQFMFKPVSTTNQKITTIAKPAPREAFWVEVADAAALKAGQDVVIRHKSEEYTRYYFAPLPLDNEWTRLFGKDGGMNIFEIHTITKIEGNRIRFKNPVHYEIKIIPDKPFEVSTYTSIEECGIEDILFTSNWKTYPEEFIHHKNEIHDYAWEAVGLEYVKNSWVRNCEFRDWNEAIFMRSAYNVTVTDCQFTGKKGHASVHARTGYGVLIKNSKFNGAHHHGAGTGYSASNTVITNCQLGVDQNIDSHSGQPTATLYDNITGGVFYNLGGPLPGLPHHGKYLVMWNFKHQSAKDYNYNFWDVEKRRNQTIAAPIFVGFQPDKKITFENAGIDEMRGKQVEPKSLFEAQLKLRLAEAKQNL